jgi:hypothetical protein
MRVSVELLDSSGLPALTVTGRDACALVEPPPGWRGRVHLVGRFAATHQHQ